MTRTAATFLVGVAVTAASGCMAADRGEPDAVPRQPSAPRSPAALPPQPAGQGGQPERLVEAPVHEVLEAALLPSELTPPTSEPRQPAAGPQQKPRPAAPPKPRRTGHRTAPEPDGPRPPHRPPHHEADPPAALPEVPVSAADVCALGTGYGGWSPNSPKARICRDTYGK
ncbi:hypothetical protein [Streptomyces sp. NPDC051561]|uniref:hypothetical protein n=1 Tax=Streptomyces sp. NPDC051561 TaxID=3365658 RepID=UPI003788AD13